MLFARGLWLDLDWVRREENSEADALTNGDYTLFDPALRMVVVWAELPFDIMARVVQEAQTFVQEMATLKDQKKRLLQASGTPRRMKKRVKLPWG